GQTEKAFAGAELFRVLTPVVGLKADIPSPEQLVAVHIPLAPFQDPDGCETMRCVVLTPGGDYETPGVHHASRRRCGCVAARGARAAAGDTGHWLHERGIARYVRGAPGRVSAGSQRGRLR